MIQPSLWTSIELESPANDPSIWMGQMAEVELPPSAFKLDATAIFRPESGVHIRGAGATYDIRWLGHFGRFTALGSDGLDTLLDFDGTTIVQVSNLSLFGRIDVNKVGRSKRLIKTHWVNGYGASDFTIRHTKFFDADVGIEAGNLGDLMCDFVNAFRTDFIACGAGFRTLNVQSLCHRFEQCGAEACDVVYDLQAGGNVTVEGGGCTNCQYILKAGPSGQNAAGITINNYRSEGPARFEIGSYRKVDINNLWMCDADPLFDLTIKAAATVTIKGGFLRGLKEGCMKVAAGSLLILDNVLLPEFSIKNLKIEKGGAVIMRECQKTWGNQLHPNNTYRG